MLTIGIESSCDDTSVAILRNGDELLSLVKKSQVDLHAPFGGVVPELAARGHMDSIFPVMAEALKQSGLDLSEIDLVAGTTGPGLIGSLLVGLTAAKTLALCLNKPFIAVHHLEAHFAANFLEHENLEYPMLGLLVSGGHSCLYILESPGEFKLLGETRDDAVGEVYDKIAKKLGLGMPGGPVVDKVAREFEGKNNLMLTPPMLHTKDYDFSFSGLKTACLLAMDNGHNVDQICEALQSSAVRVLTHKTMKALKEYNLKTLLLAGGVSANSGLRTRFQDLCRSAKVRLAMPTLKLCTDNGAMVARSGWERFVHQKQYSKLCVDAFSRMPLQNVEGGGLWQKYE